VRSITSWAELNQVGTVVTMAAVALYAISLHSIGSGLPRGRNVER
jgi:hypothetical protein